MVMEYNKCFYEEKTCKFFKTLNEAVKGASTAQSPCVYRVWVDENMDISGQVEVFAFGEHICPVRVADRIIEQKIKEYGKRQ